MSAAPIDASWAALAALVLVALGLSHVARVRLVRLSGLLRRARETPVLAVALLVGWAWLGWHFFAR